MDTMLILYHLPVMRGLFNSSSYDINVIKKYLPQVLMKHNKKFGNVSKSEKLWIHSIEEELGRHVEQNKRIAPYNVHGYDEESNTVYEFNGCFFHGCSKCYKMSILLQETQWAFYMKRQ
jgi:hypothetical protein